MEQKFTEKFKEQIGDFEGVEDVLNLSALNDEDYEQLSDDEKENLKNNWISSSATDLRKEVRIINEPNSIFDLYRKYLRFLEWEKNGEKEEEKQGLIILEPEFQRDNVWSLTKQQELIESVLLGIPLPAFYFSEDRNGNYIVVDGKQRLTTFFKFMYEGMRLGKNLKTLVNNKSVAKHEDFEAKLRNKFEDFKLICYIVSSTTSPVIQNEIFLRVNRGGIILNKQEIRNALNQGKSTRLLNNISQNENIAFVAKKRKKDQYIALRFFSFYLFRKDEEFISWYMEQIEKQGIDKFNVDVLLDLTMKYINKNSQDFSDRLYTLFCEAYDKSQIIFAKLQRAQFSRGESRVVNMNIFEVWMYLMDSIDFDEKSETIIDSLCYEYTRMINDEEFIDKILYLRDQEERINYRFKYVEGILERINDR